ncbi:curli biogenesis system outer membrane secretion channel CsgG [Brevundimonas vesicularis]|uniref:holdfast anchoring protein HfaB n=1 Tax=Brevundimonas vesicularis TaxID=41276 RepID=UPI0018EA6C99|nr:holdfast anchoring protein HfaB [Brevundimonas vesicularis]MDQ1193835.1 curli biogenesis system outer membrane secretion channel CsgG [Brevundimonas vesicularis]
MRLRQVLQASLIAAVGLAGCASTHFDPETGLYAKPIGGAPATGNDTAYSGPLRCLSAAAQTAGRAAPRLAVGDIADLTGRNDLETGRKISQGASLFAVTALTKAGVPTVERQDRGVSEVERQYAQAHLLSDTPQAAGQSPENFRAIYAGQIAGSRYYVVGGVTELNYNLRSSGADVAAGGLEASGVKGSLTNSGYVMNIAIDLRLVDTQSQEVVATASYQKQLVGREIRVGVFDFLNGNIFDLSAGTAGMEPIQFAVRTALERGLYDFVADLYAVPRDRCLPDAEIAPHGESLLARRTAAALFQSAQPVAAPQPAPPAHAVQAVQASPSPPRAPVGPPARWVLDPSNWRAAPASAVRGTATGG